MEHIPIDRIQRARLEQVDDPFVPGLRPHAPPRMVVSFTNRDPPSAVGDMAELEPEHLSRPQGTVEHQQHHRQIPQTGHALQQRSHLRPAHRTWQPVRQPDPHLPADRLLPTRIPP